jgi:hypothetical protein
MTVEEVREEYEHSNKAPTPWMFSKWDVKVLLDEIDRLKLQIQGHCDRIAVQSSLLSKRSEKDTFNESKQSS